MTIDGELVVDLWGGTADRDAGPAMPWERDTIINVWSTTKTVSALACLHPRRPGRARPVRPGRQGLAGVRRRRQGRHRGPPPDEPHGRAVRAGRRRSTIEDLYDWEKVDVAARRPGAVVGAGHGVGLPRRHPGLPRGRGRAPGHRADDRRVRRQGDHRPARRRLPHRHRPPSTTPGSPTSSRRARRCRSTASTRARSPTAR